MTTRARCLAANSALHVDDRIRFQTSTAQATYNMLSNVVLDEHVTLLRVL